MSATYDAVIVGAGIVGAACAMECAMAGMHVAVVERDAIGSGATAAGMGHIVVMDDSPAQLRLTQYSQELWNALSAELPSRVEYERAGTLWIAADEEEMAEAERKKATYEASAVQAELLGASDLAAAEPNLRRDLAGGLLVLNDAVLYPPCAAAFLLEKAQAAHTVSIILGRAVTTVVRGVVTLDDGTRLRTERIVNAAGAWSPRLTPGLQVKQRKGHLLITDRYPGFLRHQLVELGYLKSAHATTADSVAFNVQPRKTGQVLVGSSRQYDVEDSAVDRAILASMLSRAERYMPAIGSLSAIRVWTGFRAATPDKLPLIGPTEDPTVFLATGHEGLGITTSLATARLLADHFTGRPSHIPLAPYLPERYAMEASHA